MTILCFFRTETTGLHGTNDNVTKKNLFDFARLLRLEYLIIDYNKDTKEYEELVNKNIIIQPRCLVIPNEKESFCPDITQEIAEKEGIDIEIVLNDLKNDLKKVDYIITHNVDFHLKTVIAEYVRYNIPPEFFKYKIIDIVSFNHNYKYPKLKDLAENLKIKNITKKTNLELIFSIFFKLIKK
jgi:DNA polymerase III epsilon subunit-like protein